MLCSLEQQEEVKNRKLSDSLMRVGLRMRKAIYIKQECSWAACSVYNPNFGLHVMFCEFNESAGEKKRLQLWSQQLIY